MPVPRSVRRSQQSGRAAAPRPAVGGGSSRSPVPRARSRGPWRWGCGGLPRQPGQGGSGSGQAAAGGPVDVLVAATTGNADLLPGRAGAAYFTLHNTASSSPTFDQVVPGARAVSDNTGLCASSYVSLAQTLPYSFSPAITVSPGGTSGTQSIPALVKLAPNAPNTCQGVTFTVTFTLSGRSS